jgi:hypothetical protein
MIHRLCYVVQPSSTSRVHPSANGLHEANRWEAAIQHDRPFGVVCIRYPGFGVRFDIGARRLSSSMLHWTVSMERRQSSRFCDVRATDGREMWIPVLYLHQTSPESRPILADAGNSDCISSLFLAHEISLSCRSNREDSLHIGKSIRVEQETPPASVSRFTLILNMTATSPTSGSCMTHRLGKSTAGECRVYYSGRGGRMGVCIIRYACDVTVSRRKALAGTGWAAMNGGELSRR